MTKSKFSNGNNAYCLQVTKTGKTCAVGESVGKENLAQGKIPVLSCEGACIRGEIARLAASMIAKEEPYARTCHGELFTVPKSAMAHWTKRSEKIVLIDGCYLKCHRRMLENLVDKEKIVLFDALAIYKKYTDVFDIDDVPEAERKETARFVADSILAMLDGEKLPVVSCEG